VSGPHVICPHGISPVDSPHCAHLLVAEFDRGRALPFEARLAAEQAARRGARECQLPGCLVCSGELARRRP
jgi:hypothetical protein